MYIILQLFIIQYIITYYYYMLLHNLYIIFNQIYFEKIIFEENI